MTPAEVRAQAACKSADPEIFHAPERFDEAKTYCRRCPVIGGCLAWAMQVGDTHAVLGGTTPGERHRPSGQARRCAGCQRPLTPKGKPIPPGHTEHAGHGLCGVCAYHRRKAT